MVLSSTEDLMIDCKITELLTATTMAANNPNICEFSRLYLQQVFLAQEAERLRIARELHDRTIQSLIVVLHQMERFLDKNKKDYTLCFTFIIELSATIKSIVREVRYLSSSLRPSVLDHLGLIPSIEYLVEGIKKEYGIATNLSITGRKCRFLHEVEASIFRIIQEALHNVVRHAEATAVEINFEFNSEVVKFSVRDNGKGIEDIPHLKEQLVSKRKLGLVGMFERVNLIDGKISLRTYPGKGTVVLVSFSKKGKLIH